ncbi:DUF6896 domain-containing protein [Micromonospora sp. NPDC048930]|uniref:DUF6896 domain-containing protein n=1 Tax=Micromonospora sp. NPDC048930 TaxID=3364261 RepID=UPI00371D4197
MSASEESAIRAAVHAFVDARRLVHDVFATASAAELVQRVIRGEIPREGSLGQGVAYAVHGVGFTVVGADGAQVHIDSCDQLDCFNVYDIRMYLSELVDELPSISTISEICDRCGAEGLIRKVDDVTYAI